jgi:integrase
MDNPPAECIVPYAMQSVDDSKGSEAMTVSRDRGRWRYRTTAYYANGKPVRINGSSPKYNDTRQAALDLEAAHCERMRGLLPGQTEEPTNHDSTTADTSEPAVPTIPTVAEFQPLYLDLSRLDNKPSSLVSKEGILRTHVVPHLGPLRLDQVTYAVIEDLKLALSQTQAAHTKATRMLSPKTIQNVLVVLSDMLGTARKRGVIPVMPEIDWLKIPVPEFDFLDFGEADRLILHAGDAWRCMITVALLTGMRLGELLGLRWIDVDLSAGRIVVRQSYVDGVFGLPKSGKPREIPLGEDAIAALAAHRHDRGPLVFCDAKGNVLTHGKTARPLIRAFRAAGLRPIGWHTLRHTFASHLAMRGVTMRVIQELMGHASIVTTQRYAHLAPHVARDAVRLLDRGNLRAVRSEPANPAPAGEEMAKLAA